MDDTQEPLLTVSSVTKRHGEHIGCKGVTFQLWPGEILGIAGELGIGQVHAAALPGRARPPVRRTNPVPP